MKFKGKIDNINHIVISDPTYKEDVWCRYEKKDINEKDWIVNLDIYPTETKIDDYNIKGVEFLLLIKKNEYDCNIDEDGNLSYLKDIELIGNARIKQDGNDSYADNFFYNAGTKLLTAKGNTTSNALMDDGTKLVLKSDRQEYLQDKSIFNASGNVRVWYQDYYAVGPKVTVHPNEKGKPNEVYFSGRSSITQGVRTIYADKITMTMKPKSFHADGNTRTVIRNIGSGDNTNNDGIGLGL